MSAYQPSAENTSSNKNPRFASLWGWLAGALIALAETPAGQVEAALVEILRRIGDAAHSQRSYVALLSQDGLFVEQVIEWRAAGVEPIVDGLRGRLFGSLPEAYQQLHSLKTLRTHTANGHSMLLCPLVSGQRLNGFLACEAGESAFAWDSLPDALGLTVKALSLALQRSAAEAALDAAGALMEARLAERTREFERLGRVGEALGDMLKVLNSNRALPDVLQYIVEQANALLAASATLIRHADLQQHRATIEASANLPAAFDAVRSTRMHDSASDMILMSRRPVIIPDLQSTYAPVLNMPDAMEAGQSAFLEALLQHYRSMMSVPLFIREEIYGSLTFYFAEHNDFTEEDIQLALALGDQAALAIENTRLYREEQFRREEAERRRQVAESLRDVIAALNSPQALDAILQRIVSEAANLLHTDAAAIYMLWRDQDVLVIRASRGLSSEVASQIRIPVGRGLAGHAVMSRRPVAVSDAALAVGVVPEADLLREEREALERLVERYRAFFSVPLVSKDQVYGAINLYYHHAHPFTEEEIALAVSFADQAALAIENARLRDSAEQAAVATERTRLARDLHDSVTQTLFSAAVISEVLPRLYERDPQAGQARLEELRLLSRSALAEMRTLLLELRPAALEETPLDTLLTQLAEAVSGRGQLQVRISVQEELEIETDAKVGLYRIAQEALNNVVKHARATQVSVALEDGWPDGGALLRISDDGVGFDLDNIPPNHMGVGIMRERAQAIGAQFSLESQPNHGTRITVRWKKSTHPRAIAP